MAIKIGELSWPELFFNSLLLNITIFILYTFLYKFPLVLKRRIC